MEDHDEPSETVRIELIDAVTLAKNSASLTMCVAFRLLAEYLTRTDKATAIEALIEASNATLPDIDTILDPEREAMVHAAESIPAVLEAATKAVLEREGEL